MLSGAIIEGASARRRGKCRAAVAAGACSLLRLPTKHSALLRVCVRGEQMHWSRATTPPPPKGHMSAAAALRPAARNLPDLRPAPSHRFFKLLHIKTSMFHARKRGAGSVPQRPCVTTPDLAPAPMRPPPWLPHAARCCTAPCNTSSPCIHMAGTSQATCTLRPPSGVFTPSPKLRLQPLPGGPRHPPPSAQRAACHSGLLLPRLTPSCRAAPSRCSSYSTLFTCQVVAGHGRGQAGRARGGSEEAHSAPGAPRTLECTA